MYLEIDKKFRAKINVPNITYKYLLVEQGQVVTCIKVEPYKDALMFVLADDKGITLGCEFSKFDKYFERV